jgi:hypothetical protein
MCTTLVYVLQKYVYCKTDQPVTATERSKACTVFARSKAGIVGSNPTQGMDVWCVYAFILCLCFLVFRYKPCDDLTTRSRSPTVCKNDHETEKSALCSKVGARERTDHIITWLKR